MWYVLPVALFGCLLRFYRGCSFVDVAGEGV